MKLDITASDTPLMTLNSADAKRLREAHLILWDEATVASCQMLRCAADCVADMCKSGLFFGGKVVLMGGDFRQCLPIVRGSSRVEIIENCIKRSPYCTNFRSFILCQNMPASSDPDYSSFLLTIGMGSPTDIALIPPEFISNGDIIAETFGTSAEMLNSLQIGNKCILFLRNDDILRLNDEVLDKL